METQEGRNMSECVVRMEMPESCPCELAGGYDIPLPCFAGYGSPKRCKEFDECVEKGTKPDWCPFVCALPEGHGRLVDARSLFDEVYEYYGQDNESNENWMMDMINCSPTIVPATNTPTNTPTATERSET